VDPRRSFIKEWQEQGIAERSRRYEIRRRPHQALDYRTPSQFYRPSPRRYPARLPELEFPEGAPVRRISQPGSLKWKGERTFRSEVLARE
jgi:hypothetical protein